MSQNLRAIYWQAMILYTNKEKYLIRSMEWQPAKMKRSAKNYSTLACEY
jgi:hypothetical protein